ncbi:MAG: ankyrin repeat domain-containing protein [Alphaproteobacteria bacterium]|nr:ankyrin repeat domain-containing protein [Alphaproteobacteria bacterium]
MYSNFAKREKTPQEKLLEKALKYAQDIPQAHEEWWDTAQPEEIDAYYDLAYTADFWENATIPQLAVVIDTRSIDIFPNDNGKTALMYACQYCPSPEVIRWYFNFQPDPYYRDKDGKTAEDYAAENPALTGCTDILAALKFENLLCDSFWKTAISGDLFAELQQGKDVNMHGISGKTPLMLACRYCRNVKIIETLLQFGADVNALSELRSNSALMCACHWNSLETVKLLVQNGADVNYATTRGYTVLMSAAEFNQDAEVIRYLVANGADVTAHDMYKLSACIYLKRNKVLSENKEIVTFLRKCERQFFWKKIINRFENYFIKKRT